MDKSVQDAKINKKQPLVMTLRDFINNSDFHTILTDNAETFDVHEQEKQLDLEENLGMEDPVEEIKPIDHFIISKEDVQAVLDKIANSDILIGNYHKTNNFMKDNNITSDDLKEIARQLSIGDYSYSMNSIVFEPGDVLFIFITKKISN